MMRPAFQFVLAAAIWASAFARPALARQGSTNIIDDYPGDAVIRRTDAGANGSIKPGTKPPDVVLMETRGWSGAPMDVVEVRVKFEGLVNPPGPLGLGALQFDPFAFGDNPVYGFMEIDIDRDRNTGGELGDGAKFRYLANLARFGEVPEGSLSERAAKDGTNLDSNFNSSPQFERSGADFALVLCGCFDVTVTNTFGDYDGQFSAGDTWIVSGRFFQRAGGYEEASAAYGGTFFGLYDPITTLQFSHSIYSDQTTLTLKFPMTMLGAAILSGQPIEAPDLDVSNHVSIFEALDDVIAGAEGGLSGPTATLANRWAGQLASEFLSPQDWGLTGLFGTSYQWPEPDGALYVWTDAAGDHGFGDFDGSSVVNGIDLAIFDLTLLSRDGGPQDMDGIANGMVRIPNFGPGFSVYDLNGDGVIGPPDRNELVPPILFGDANHDCIVNFADITSVLTHWGSSYATTGPGDANRNGQVNFADITSVLTSFGLTCP